MLNQLTIVESKGVKVRAVLGNHHQSLPINLLSMDKIQGCELTPYLLDQLTDLVNIEVAAPEVELNEVWKVCQDQQVSHHIGAELELNLLQVRADLTEQAHLIVRVEEILLRRPKLDKFQLRQLLPRIGNNLESLTEEAPSDEQLKLRKPKKNLGMTLAGQPGVVDVQGVQKLQLAHRAHALVRHLFAHLNVEQPQTGGAVRCEYPHHGIRAVVAE